ncbi:MAG: ATP-dependent Clp protease ATP-binding subunit [Verrucomicrobia bacterium]|nr:ATP-dependent Clp protease ATP-binding subunit [Verrucomicrobiota bacterium]
MNTTNASENLRRLALLETQLPCEIRGQNHVLPPVLSIARRGQLGLTKPGRPRGSFLSLGPTGVGKTELILVLTRVLFGLDYLFRFDMSEFQTQDALGLLLGASAGEVGMLGQVRRKSATGVLLFDEAEKAHPRILDILLQLLDAARLTTANGEAHDFSGFYVWLTSNLGSAELLMLQHSSEATLERHVLTRAEQALRPEIFARIDEKLVFHRLGYDQQLEVAAKFLAGEVNFLHEQGHELEVADGVLPLLVRKGIHPKLGMRPMRHAVETLVGDAVARELLSEKPCRGRLAVDASGEALTVQPK